MAMFSSPALPQLAQYVNPFIGTGGHGHTFPGATMPFGMVQLSPDTDIRGWDWCSGYHASDSSILGFSHTHLSGTGGADYGDILIKPLTGKLYLTPGDKQHKTPGYRSLFSHKDETAEAGYYKVFLKQHKILAELTATIRAGFHKYTFNTPDSIHIIFDLAHGIADKAKQSSIKIISDTKIAGLRKSSGWAEEQYVYFTAEFSEPFTRITWANGDAPATDVNSSEKEHGIAAAFHFTSGEGKVIKVKIAISAVDAGGAEKNLRAEIPGWDFWQIKKAARLAWEKELQKITVEGKSKDDKIKFYSAMYHCMICPNTFSDVDGRYRGMDGKIHFAEGYTHYTLFSLWDTFRALHPLLNMIDKKRSADFIRSMLDKYEQYGLLPVWELAGNETGCMIGYHAVPVIADAIANGITGFDREKAFTAMKKSANQEALGIGSYNRYGFIPSDRETDAVSRTVEYALDDWCIAKTAALLNHPDDEKVYQQRALRYENVFDTSTGFMRGRYSDGRWRVDFDPAETFPWGVSDFTEGNAWQYSWVPYQTESSMQVNTEKKLDALFNAAPSEKYRKVSDVTGLIGEYAHGNEPSHWIAYLYATLGAASKTQFRVRDIMNRFYGTGRDGLIGNEDCGQMSAWFVFSAMGFYPVMPASGEYILGSPLFNKVNIKLENGKTFSIIAPQNATENIYVKSIKLGTNEKTDSKLSIKDIQNGSRIIMDCSARPEIGSGMKSVSVKKSKAVGEALHPVFTPYLQKGSTCFYKPQYITLNCLTPNGQIRFTLDGSEPDANSGLYRDSILIKRSTTLKAATFINSGHSAVNAENRSIDVLEQAFYRTIYRDTINPVYLSDGFIYPALEHKTPYSLDYAASGPNALIDGVRGTSRYTDRKWQSHDEKQDLDVIIDFGKQAAIDSIAIGLLYNSDVWILYPRYVTFSSSDDGVNFKQLSKTEIPDLKGYVIDRKDVSTGKLNITTRYVRIFAKNYDGLPAWHRSAGNNVLMFADEVLIYPKD